MTLARRRFADRLSVTTARTSQSGCSWPIARRRHTDDLGRLGCRSSPETSPQGFALTAVRGRRDCRKKGRSHTGGHPALVSFGSLADADRTAAPPWRAHARPLRDRCAGSGDPKARARLRAERPLGGPSPRD